jgi:hypothetical protein
MKWLKRKVYKWVKEIEREPKSINSQLYPTDTISCESDRARPDAMPILSFRVYSANNGQVLEFNHYDSHRDRSNNSVYLIPEDENIADYVAKCVTLESLR